MTPAHPPRQTPVPAMYMRGGTSKGVFLLVDDLPEALRHDPAARDRWLLRVVGSPDPYGQHIDGLGGATSSTSKVVLVGRSTRPGCDVDYWFGQVSVQQPVIDWSGNCGNLSAAVGPFALHLGLVPAPADGSATVRIWQANLGKRIVAHVPMAAGEVVELGDFELDGVAFPAAEIRLEFLDPGAGDGAMFPTGRCADTLRVPGVGELEATLIDAGNPTIFVHAASIGLAGTEMPAELNTRAELLQRLEHLRAHAAVAMGLAATPEDATAHRPHTPKLAFVTAPAGYVASNGKPVAAEHVDLVARIVSMGKVHHAMTGTGAVAIAVAAAIPGTLVHGLLASPGTGAVRFGHPSGVMHMGAEARQVGGRWQVTKALMSRSARRLMIGSVYAPQVA